MSNLLIMRKFIPLDESSPDVNTKMLVNIKQYEESSVDSNTKPTVSILHFDIPLTLSLYRNEQQVEQPFQTIDCTFNKKYPTLPDITRSHYKFLGYSKTKNGNTAVTSSDIVQYAETNLYAMWLAASHLNFDYQTNGGTSISGNTNADYYVGYTIDTLPIATHATKNFSGWYTAANGGSKITAATVFTAAMNNTTLYAQFTDSLFEVTDLGSEWELNSGLNPDPSLYAGCYQSFSNYNVDNSTATMTIRVVGYNSFKLYIRSCSEDCCDYVSCTSPGTMSSDEAYYLQQKEYYESLGYYVYEDDYGGGYHEWYVYDSDGNYVGGGSYQQAGATTQSMGNCGTSIEDYTYVEFNFNDPTENFVYVKYTKDVSVSSNDDRGYVLIPHDQS